MWLPALALDSHACLERMFYLHCYIWLGCLMTYRWPAISPWSLGALSSLIVGVLLSGITGAQNAALGTGAAPDPLPVLRIETGMHSTPWHIGADTQCRLLVTASDDEAVRLWSLPDGKLLRTVRLPLGPGNFANAFAVAVSPDGRLVAAGGTDAALAAKGNHGVYVFDSATGASMRRLGAFPEAITNIEFSSDGRLLAVSLRNGAGIRVLDITTGHELMTDPDFGGKDSFSLAFGVDGSLFAVGFDGQLRRYGPDLKLSARVTASTDGHAPNSVAIDPTGQRLAVGFAGSKAIDIYEAATLRRIGAADTADVNGNLFPVVWSADGTRIFAGGNSRDRAGRYQIRSWTRDGKEIGTDVGVADSSISSLKPCGDAIAFGTMDPAFGLLRPVGASVTLGRARKNVDMRQKLGDAFKVSDDGKQIQFGLSSGAENPVIFDLTRALLTDAVTTLPRLSAPKINGLPLTDWKNNTAPRFDGQPIEVRPNSMSYSLAVRPDNTGFVLGTSFYLSAYGANGTLRWNRRGYLAYGVNLARDGELVLAAHADSTILGIAGQTAKKF
jgi:dipeptidyl aminopeptidase/acylaminoacyl peptidase